MTVSVVSLLDRPPPNGVRRLLQESSGLCPIESKLWSHPLAGPATYGANPIPQSEWAALAASYRLVKNPDRVKARHAVSSSSGQARSLTSGPPARLPSGS